MRSEDCASVNFPVWILYCNYARCHRWGRLGEWCTRPSCTCFCHFLWSYYYFKIKFSFKCSVMKTNVFSFPKSLVHISKYSFFLSKGSILCTLFYSLFFPLNGICWRWYHISICICVVFFFMSIYCIDVPLYFVIPFPYDDYLVSDFF